MPSRDVSLGEHANSQRKHEEAETPTAVSVGLVEVRCSGEVNEAEKGAKEAETAVEDDGYGTTSGTQLIAIGHYKAVHARLLALEHVLAAIAGLLDVGDLDRARALAHAWSTATHPARDESE